MLSLYSPQRANSIIARYSAWIADVSARFGVPEAVIKAILFQEMTQIDAMDPFADAVVRLGISSKTDSSTGYAQIFGYVGLNAINFSVDRGLATYESLGIVADHRLDPRNLEDVRMVWKKLHDDPKFNIEVATLNILASAYEMVGHGDFSAFSDDELKLVLTRYNANVKSVTKYGEEAFGYYQLYRQGIAPDAR